MAKTKDPAFLMYSKDWIEGTADMTPEEKGIYIDLLCYQHQRNGLPNDIGRLARLVRVPVKEFEGTWEFLKSKFISEGGLLRNIKLNEVMIDRAEKGKKNRITGTFAAVLRKFTLKLDEYEYIKLHFNLLDFYDIPNENLSERITKWCTERLLLRSKSIEDENEDENINVIKKEDNVEIIFVKRWSRPFKNHSELQGAEKLVLEFGYKKVDDAFRKAGENGITTIPYVRGILNKEREEEKPKQKYSSSIMNELYGDKLGK